MSETTPTPDDETEPQMALVPVGDAQLLATAIDTLGEQPEIDVVLDHLMRIAFLKRFAKEYEPKLKAFLVAEIERTGQPIRMGEFIWIKTDKKETKCNDPVAAMQAITDAALAHFGGDIEAASKRAWECISANGIKHATAEKTLTEFGAGKEFDKLFTKKIKKDAVGNPVRELSCANTAFMKPKA